MNNIDQLITLKEAARYLKYTYRGFWGVIKRSYKQNGVLPNGIYDISTILGIGNKKVYRINLQEFIHNNQETPKKIQIHKITAQNACKSLESAYFTSLSNKTIKTYKRAVSLLDEFYEDNEINKANLYEFITHLRNAKNLKDTSVKKYLKALNVIFKQSVNQGLIKSSPLQDFDKQFLKEEVRIEYLRLQERELLIKENINIDKELTNAFEFAIETGLRANEQTRLTWNNIDFEEKEAYITETKTKQNRVIILSNKAISILKDNKSKGYEKPFKAYSCGYPYCPARWKKAKQRAGIVRKFNWHDLRHTFGTYCVKGLHSWLSAPMNLQQTATLMGHASINMTVRYAHLDISDVKKLFNH